MLNIRGVQRAIAMLQALVIGLPAIAIAQVATPLMVGRWHGDAEIVVNWTTQRTLPVNLIIFTTDKVTGTIGDATLENGKLRKNRGWIASTMHWKTEYIIDATLVGPIIRVEHIERASVRMPLNFVNGRFEGGINTSGSKVGGAENMVLAAKVVLHAVPDMILCDAATTQCRQQ